MHMAARVAANIIVMLGIAFASVAAATEATGPPRGAELLAPFKQQLTQALTAGLAQGPESAISALARETRVLPVLVEGPRMPSSWELP